MPIHKVSTYPREILPSIKFGLFHHIKVQVRYVHAEIATIASNHNWDNYDNKVQALNYLFMNDYISSKQANMLADQLVHWKGMCERKRSTFFTDDHKSALIALVQDYPVRGISIENVVAQLQGLNCNQAIRIANGLTRRSNGKLRCTLS